MFDKNHLKHDFIIYKYITNDIQLMYFICNKCKVIIDYGEGTKTYWIHKKTYTTTSWEKLSLTCDKMIIKNILE